MKKKKIIGLALALTFAVSTTVSVSAAAPQLNDATSGGTTQVTATIDAPEPGEVSYVITIPEKVDFGTILLP